MRLGHVPKYPFPSWENLYSKGIIYPFLIQLLGGDGGSTFEFLVQAHLGKGPNFGVGKGSEGPVRGIEVVLYTTMPRTVREHRPIIHPSRKISEA